MQIVVRVKPDTARVLRGEAGARDAGGAARVRSAVARFGASLVPQHPRLSDPELGSYFEGTDLPADDAERLRLALLEIDAVEAAYVQPPPAPA
jgi:hypothetical protein